MSAYPPSINPLALLLPFLNLLGAGQPQRQYPGYQQGPVSYPGFMYGGGQATPGGYQYGPVIGYPPQTPSYPSSSNYGNVPTSQYGPVSYGSSSPGSYGAYPPAPQYGPVQANNQIQFRPVIVQNQTNVLPLRANGGINASMTAGANLNVNNQRVY